MFAVTLLIAALIPAQKNDGRIEYRGRKLTPALFMKSCKKIGFTQLKNDKAAAKLSGSAVEVEGVATVSDEGATVLRVGAGSEFVGLAVNAEALKKGAIKDGMSYRLFGILDDGPTIRAQLFELFPPVEWKYNFTSTKDGYTTVVGTVRNTSEKTLLFIEIVVKDPSAATGDKLRIIKLVPNEAQNFTANYQARTRGTAPQIQVLDYLIDTLGD